MGKGHSPEQIVRKLRQTESKLTTSGSTIPEVARDLEVSEATFHRWSAGGSNTVG